ncbi:energy-coupling factor transporter transmembrane component T family protein [Sulfitobacter mediterraneus]|uniref:Biotin transport system permease protein n=1 Tax=Sulfitobacter mediterraneus TaxID=83219 RepID=A0A2T6CJV8_9RHOB|nr:energy-coupling factor transporter transmembrane component T [Sulfitobacter mediterraneus]PTX75767.1 biotin transport system permease protein [Sulfitobacter mediterraneus]
MISLTSPIRTRAHNWPAGAKLLSLCVATAVLFAIKDVPAQVLVFALVIALYTIPGRDFLAAGFRQLRLLWPFVLIVGLWHLWTGEFALGASVVLRMLSAVGLANLVTMTTRLSDMIDVVKAVTVPLRWFGLSSRVLEFAIALVIRLTPVLVERGGQLSQSWKARSRKAPNWRIILPFTVLALDDADYVAEALRARGGFNTKEDT